MNRLGGVALVTGGGKGLGAAIARKLASEGCRVAVLGRDAMALRTVATELDGLALEADVRDSDAVGRALSELERVWGTPTILVQNAGIAPSAPLARTTDEDWNNAFAVNVTAPFRIARAIAPMMVAKGFGRIVHVASNAGLTGYSYTAAYTASKHALVGLTRALAAELARTGVTVNAVCPGFIDTQLTARAVSAIAGKTGRDEEEARRALADLNPQKRFVTVDEVAHVVAMLCGQHASAINGQAIAIDGGQVMK